ncbi:MAG: serine/threonine-protein phosphatase [Ruminococcus sp.]|nr:serine/threonine-protein phosphatase [Ruminococcus sp.]MCM1380442.1 serine/threonine-protein phosphatase [Muribaculaceae bacterium]MCM1478412.1 serine/threonine-protein phosphatase [Muribaculaceae bacterium]
MVINSAKYSCAAGHGINEDSCLCSPERGIFIVADGLGGHSSGEKASLAAVDYFEEKCFGGYTNECITELLEGANLEVLRKGDGGKTTTAAAFTENGKFIYANVGDSRVYYFRGGKIIAQTKDHSVCQASVDMGMMRFEDIRGSEDRSRLLKVLGSEESLNIKKHYPPIPIQNGDAFLICSDGFWEFVYEAEMEADLLKSDSADAWLKYMLKRHILRAENKGDNYTAVCGIIYLDGSEDFPKTVPNAIAEELSPQKNKLLVPIAAGGALLIAAAVGIAVVLNAGKGGGEVAEPTETSSISETAEDTTVTETTSAEPTTTTVTTTATAEPTTTAVTTTATAEPTTTTVTTTTTAATEEEQENIPKENNPGGIENIPA